jgi:hypothetical protein
MRQRGRSEFIRLLAIRPFRHNLNFTFLPVVCEFFSILLAVIIDVVLAVNSESRIAPGNIHRMQRMRAMVDLGALSPYLKHDGYYRCVYCRNSSF